MRTIYKISVIPFLILMIFVFCSCSQEIFEKKDNERTMVEVEGEPDLMPPTNKFQRRGNDAEERLGYMLLGSSEILSQSYNQFYSSGIVAYNTYAPSFHPGIDYAIVLGTPVYSVVAGTYVLDNFCKAILKSGNKIFVTSKIILAK